MRYLAPVRRFLFFAYGMSVGRLIYVSCFHFRDHSLVQHQAVWFINMALAFTLILVQSLERSVTGAD